MKTAIRCLVLAGLVGLAGCLEVEQGVTLQKDLSGTATLNMTIDMDGMVRFVAKMQRDMMGKPGEPTEQELQAAREELMKKQERQREEEDAKFEDRKRRMQEALPKGVTLGETTVTHDGLKTSVTMTFAFDHVAKLAQIEFPSDDEEQQDDMGVGGDGRSQSRPRAGDGEAPRGPANGPEGGEAEDEGEDEPMKRPFDNLVVDESTPGQVRITFRPQNPAAQQEEQTADMPPEMKDLAGTMLKGVRYELRIQSPMAVVEQNATRVEGDTAIWSWDMEGLKTLQGETAPAPTVLFRKE
jgi:hypothetical protein